MSAEADFPDDSEYLGDGLYAVYVHGQIELRANDIINPSDTVYLDVSVFKQLKAFGDKHFNLTSQT